MKNKYLIILVYRIDHISFHLRFFDLIWPKYKIFGASERAAAMSGIPSSLKSPTAKPYTVPFESPKEIDVKLRPVPSLKNTVDGASMWTTMISIFLSLFRSAIASAYGTIFESAKAKPA